MKMIIILSLILLLTGCDGPAWASKGLYGMPGHSHRYKQARNHYGSSIRAPKSWNRV